MTYAELQAAVLGLGYNFFDQGAYNLNIVGVRTDDDAANTFNDWMYLAFRDRSGEPHCLAFPITTDPGVDYRLNPLNPAGAGIIVPGQHRGLWRLGFHKGSVALVQRKPVAVYRDNNRDSILDQDPSSVEIIMGGFNCHKANAHGTSKLVGKWSAGCQVFANSFEHNILLQLCELSAGLYGDSFTYTLLTEAQI